MKLTIASTVLLGSVLLSSCSWMGLDETFRDRSNDYRRSAELEHIDVPTELDSDLVGELYPIPEGSQVANYQVGNEFEVPRPRSVAINVSANEVKIQKLGSASWILTSVPPSETWPLVRSFLTRQAIPTARADANSGVIETSWFTLTDDENMLHQFLIRLSQGVQLNTTEIEITQRQVSASATLDEIPEWPEVSADEEKETWLRDTMAAALADENTLGTASLLGREIGAAQKVSIVAPETDAPYIDMDLIFQRAWASVGYALGEDGFTVSDRSIEAQYYVAEYLNPVEEERSFFQRLRGVKKAEPARYRVQLETLESGRIHVKVYGENGQPLSQRESYIVLERIRGNLA